MVATVILKSFDYTSLSCDLDLKDSKSVFLNARLVHKDASLQKVWLQKVLQFRGYHPDKHSLKSLTFPVTLTVNTAIQSFHWTLLAYDNYTHQPKCKALIKTNKNLPFQYRLLLSVSGTVIPILNFCKVVQSAL